MISSNKYLVKNAGNILKKAKDIFSKNKTNESGSTNNLKEVVQNESKNQHIDDIVKYMSSKLQKYDKKEIISGVENLIKNFTNFIPMDVLIQKAIEGFRIHILNTLARRYATIKKISFKNKSIYLQIIPYDMDDVVIDIVCNKIEFSTFFDKIYFGDFKSNISGVENALNKYAASWYNIPGKNALISSILINKLFKL